MHRLSLGMSGCFFNLLPLSEQPHVHSRAGGKGLYPGACSSPDIAPGAAAVGIDLLVPRHCPISHGRLVPACPG